ncbi:MAG: DUF4011 domain-containing protein, partial [bacterium]
MASGMDTGDGLGQHADRDGIEPALERVRTKLLDLSARNRLLNFRHPRRSSVRFVEAVPNHVYSALLDGSELELLAIKEPTQVQLAKMLPDWERADPPPAERWARAIGISTDFELPRSVPDSGAKPSLQTLLYAKDFDAVLRNVRSTARTAIEESGVNMLYLALGFLEWVDDAASSASYQAPILLVPILIDRGRVNHDTGALRYRISYSGEDIVANLSLRE